MDHCRHAETEEKIISIYGLDTDVFTTFDGLRPIVVVKSLDTQDTRRLYENPFLRHCVAECVGEDCVYFYLSSDAMPAVTMCERVEDYRMVA